MQNAWHVVVIDGFAGDRGEVELRHDKQLAMKMIVIYRKNGPSYKNRNTVQPMYSL